MKPVAVVVMGVSGVGKSTVGRALAGRLGWEFGEGDALHPTANVARMRAGVPLTDADRKPWLAAVRAWIEERAAAGRSVVVSCSALKQRYRDELREARGARVVFAHLDGGAALVRERLAGREGHFMPVSLLASQLADLEPLGADEDGVRVPLRPGDRGAPLDAIIAALPPPER